MADTIRNNAESIVGNFTEKLVKTGFLQNIQIRH